MPEENSSYPHASCAGTPGRIKGRWRYTDGPVAITPRGSWRKAFGRRRERT